MLDQLSTKQKVALAVALPASVVLVYLLFKKRDDDEVSGSSKSLATGQRQSIEMNIPHDKVGPLIGREGCNIKRIQSESGAHINFSDETRREDMADRHLRIHGNRDSVLLAERLILEFLAEQPEIVTKFLMLPQQVVGRVIGKQGSNIRKIQNSSKARVKIDREAVEDQNTLRRCTIRGSLQQVDTAESMIREEINEMEDYQQRLAEAAAKRKERPSSKSGRNAVQPVLTGQPGEESGKPWQVDPSAAAVEHQDTREFFTVYMSAVENPEHFWLQMVNQKAQELDLMLETMTEFYNQPENQESFKPDNLQCGEIVAAPFPHDQMWYRTRVISFLDDDTVDLYYVDYGDSEAVPKSTICSLRDDFLSLAFQAVEFSLANTYPVGESWSEEAIVFFEGVTKVAKWKALEARIVDYKSTEAGTIPCVELFDTSGQVDINIGKQLRNHGFARSSRFQRYTEAKEVKDTDTSSTTSPAAPISDGDGAHVSADAASIASSTSAVSHGDGAHVSADAATL